ncbi:MAG: exodeoxyribonuclease VII large subunit [Candidimonas sp.]|nr:MAG: exodeoxyribonuclease VII large subunit [Candidimonas sp.]TAM20298.1 MAG: exodeoxyribonuclease VII large subunit [Candidimonas sp.]TAM79917.1 MAG: exodeoxyribonuclease VII large subunit [Candidimonas sp.]
MHTDSFSALRGDAVLSVSELNRQVSELLAGNFSQVWVKGEISNFTQAASGHWYFTIKDERSAVRAVMFRGRTQSLGFVPKAGERFEFRSSVTLYEARGDYQLQVEMLRCAGRGDLHEAFLLLKEKLAAEGLFDPGRKRPIALMPRAVGVVTSLAAAALRDVLSTMARRAPHISIVIYPAPVQGQDAAARLREALGAAYERREVDTLLLVRGGGSIEDLWSFNDERLARLVAASPVPLISGVGHETDFTMVDFVADLRAPTPTAAAELCCQAREDSLLQLESVLASLGVGQRRLLERAALRLDRAVALLVSPRQRLAQQSERLMALRHRLLRAAPGMVERRFSHVDALRSRLGYARPDIDRRRRDLARPLLHLARAAQRQVSWRAEGLASLMQTLEALNPKKILGRGYAIVRDEHGVLIKEAQSLNAGDRLSLELSQGVAQVAVLQAHGLS